MAKKLTLDELASLREKGIVSASDEQIAAKRAERAAKKIKAEAEQEAKQDLERYFPAGKRKARLQKLQKELRELRKQAVREGINRLTLPEELKKPYYVAFTLLAPTAKEFNKYREYLGDLLIEGLKIQDREVKIFSYDYLDKLMGAGFYDVGFLYKMLSKKYVSRYGWKLLRKYASNFKIGYVVFVGQLEAWADDPKTWENWRRLASEDHKPVDTRELFPRRRFK